MNHEKSKYGLLLEEYRCTIYRNYRCTYSAHEFQSVYGLI